MSAISRARAHLNQKLDGLLAKHGVPALSAVLVRDGGDAVVACARGLRKSDAGADNRLNRTQLTDRFNIGSISKPVTGYLIAYLVQTRPDLNWSTKLADVFTEFRSLVFRRRYGIREDYLDVTVAQLMTHNAGFPGMPPNSYEVLLHTEATERPYAFVFEYSNEASEVLRRYNTLVTYMQEKPEPKPGPDVIYSRGALICASMAERLTGQTYKQLLKTLVFDKLGMSHSGVGTLSTATAPDNTWQHSYDAAAGTITPNQVASKGAWGYHSFGPTGKVYMSAEDMGRFITANLHRSGKPKAVVSDTTLRHAQEQPAPGETPFTRGGWKASTETDGEYVLWHNGNNNKSYAELTISPERNYGYAAMCNVSGKIGKEAVAELNDILEDMHANWTTAFAIGPAPEPGRAPTGTLSPGRRRRRPGLDDLEGNS